MRKPIFRLMDQGRLQDALIRTHLTRLPSGPDPVYFESYKLIWNDKIFFAIEDEVVLPIDQTRQLYFRFLKPFLGEKPRDLRVSHWQDAEQPLQKPSLLKIFSR